MYLYRGLNSRDYELYRSNKDILCNLTRKNLSIKNSRDIIYEVAKKDLSLSLDRIIGHVSGLNINYSCWISSSSDYNYVLTEYCIPQCGRYNIDLQRKNVIVVDTDKEINEKIDRNSTNTSDYIGHYIDLSNNNLSKYVTDKFVFPISENIKSYNYCNIRSVHPIDYIPNVNRFNNFAYGASEHLFFISIKKNDIKYIIKPLIQDIIYSYTYGIKDRLLIENIIDTCMKNKSLIEEGIANNTYNFTPDELKLINYLYVEKDNKYNNLIDLIEKYYHNTHDIVSDYEVLKDMKRNILSKITGLIDIKLVDDSIYVINDKLNNQGLLYNNKKINKRNKNDIIFITDENGNLHRGNSKLKK